MGNTVRIGLSALLVSLIVAASAQQTINYTVKKGDSLYTIAHRHGLRLPDLLKVNNLRNPHALQPGQVIKIPVKGSANSASGKTRTASAPTSGWAEINKDRINIRQKPSVNSPRITIVDRWTKVKVLARQGEWSRVQLTNGRTGWVKSVYLSPTQPPRTAAARTASTSTPRKTASTNRRFPQRQAPAVQANNERTRQLLQKAMAYLGSPYRRGGSSSRGFDCSGFTSYIFRHAGVHLPHHSAAQARVGKPVPRNQLQPGDLVFFRTRGRRISHVGIYIGNGKFIHASSARGRVRIDSLNSGYYSKRYAGARRVPH
ncbi:Cell wall-associated hydrolase, NlpC family [Armatimonadetes bacterium DC]|nr:Cell wall-associated hydrolase, NlpC family [Armatimonadetes bacterium DC]